MNMQLRCSPTPLLLFLAFALILDAPVLLAATYYVDSRNGQDSNDGLTPSSAWRSLGKVNRDVNRAGDDVRLRSGSVFEDQTLEIGWSGTASDWASVDCYKVDSAGKAVGCSTDDLKPEINGTFEPSCAKARLCSVHTANAVPSTEWSGLVTVRASYVSLRNLSVKDSASISVSVSSSPTEPKHDFLIENIDVEHSFHAVLLAARSIKNGVIRRVKGKQFGLCELYQYQECSTVPWKPGMTIGGSPDAQILIEDNEITQGYGEGIACLRSSHVTIRNNRVGNTHAMALYLDNCSNAIVERNIVWGDPANEFRANRGFAAVSVYTEDYKGGVVGSSVNNIIRNNLLTGLGACISAGQEENSALKGFEIGYHAYGNTCVGFNGTNIAVHSGSTYSANVSRIVVQNNIFYSPERSRLSCSLPVNPNIQFSNNFWDSSEFKGACSGAGDRIGDPKLVTTLSEFKTFDSVNPPKAFDFSLQANSPAESGGASLNVGSLFEQSEYYFIDTKTQDNCPLSSKPLAFDYYCSERQEPFPFGAIGRTKYPPLPPVIFVD